METIKALIELFTNPLVLVIVAMRFGKKLIRR